MELDVGTRAILKLFLLPPGLLILLLLLGWLFARRVFGRLLILLTLLLFYGLTIPAGVEWLAGALETVPAPGKEEIRRSRAEAIVVFLAGTRRHNPELGGADTLNAMSLERMDHALRLHRETGLPIMLSGGATGGDHEPVARAAARWLERQAGITPLAVEDGSRDTYENALNTAALLQKRELGRVLLVTHAFHMPRARLSARAAGLDAMPAPFGFIHTPVAYAAPPRATDWLPQSGRLEQAYLLLHEMAGLVWYGMTRG